MFRPRAAARKQPLPELESGRCHRFVLMGWGLGKFHTRYPPPLLLLSLKCHR